MKGSFLIFSVLLMLSCSPSGGPHKPLDLAPAAAPPSEQVTDYSQIRPIFAEYCSSCHPSRSAPNWLDYQSTINYVQNGMLELRVVDERSMPPVGSRESALLTQADRDLIAKWIQNGAPEKAASPDRAQNDVRSNPQNSAQSCLDCHGVTGPRISARHDIPKLNGQNSRYLQKQLMDFKWFERRDPGFEMNKQALEMTDQEILDISNYFAQSEPMADTNADVELTSDQQRLLELGQVIAENACNSCHYRSEISFGTISEEVPVLCGQTEQYLTNQLIYFQKGMRKNNLMEAISSKLTREEIIALSLYYSLENPGVSDQTVQR